MLPARSQRRCRGRRAAKERGCAMGAGGAALAVSGGEAPLLSWASVPAAPAAGWRALTSRSLSSLCSLIAPSPENPKGGDA
jgi:hypothetical protein